jgi:serine/threonine-protein kinase
MPTHPLIGKELGNYAIKSLIGEGGMGVVFAGEHRFLGTKCAIKVLHGSYANNPQVTQRFFQEARTTLEIDHPNIVRIFDLGQSNDGALYLVMELLQGRSLGQAIAEGGFGEGAVARIGSLVAEGLAAAHAKGIVHRDLKPDNIFLTGDQVKVLDFGIAKVMQSSSSTKTGSLLGTPQYMAPEQAKGSKHVGPHTDVYALGAILFEMLTGQPPFVGEDLPELLAKQLFEPPPSPRTLVACSTEMENIILSCLEKDPAARPASMLELRDRLKTRIGVAPPSRTMAAKIAPTITPMQGQSISAPIAVKSPSGSSPALKTPTPPAGTVLRTSTGPQMKTPTPPSGTALPTAMTQGNGPVASTAPTGPTTPLPGARPYTPTYTPSTLASAASEVIVQPPEPMRPETVRNALILTIAAVVVFISVGIVAAIKKPWVKPPQVAAPQVAAPQVAAIEKPVKIAEAPKPIEPPKPVARVQPQPQKVVVRSEPSGAVVTVEGRAMGPTPALLTLSLPQEVFLSMKGYRTAREVLSSPGEITIRLQAEAPKHVAVKSKPPEKLVKPIEKGEKKEEKAASHFKEGLD